MSGISISPYFPFRRIKIAKQAVDAAATKAVIDVAPDRRFQPVCHLCGNIAPTVHSWTQRSVRDLNLASTQVWLRCEYRKLLCAHCQRISIEEVERGPVVEDIGWVQNMLGHSSLQMIFTRYYAWIPRSTRKDGLAFLNLVPEKGEGRGPERPCGDGKVIPLFEKSDTKATQSTKRAHDDEP